jgi:hypothetical protein
MSTEPSRELNARKLALVQQDSESPGAILGGHEDNNLVKVEEVQNVDQLAILLLLGELALVLLEANQCELVRFQKNFLVSLIKR